MKRIIAMAAATAVLLTGCGYLGEESETAKPGAEVQTGDFIVRNVSEINIFETGGEDGRINNWLISQTDGCNIVVLTDRMRKTSTYNISDEDFQALTHIDFSNYVGIKADTENIADAIYYNIEIIYDDSTKDIIEVYIPVLWSKLYEITGTYEPVEEKPFKAYDTDSDTPFPETGTIGGYDYRIDNYKQGAAERGYYFDKENRPDSPLYVYISGGEYSSGGHGLYITNIEVKNGSFIITVKETSPKPGEEVTEALEYPGCMVEISPKPEFVEVKNPNGSSFEYIVQAYYKEVGEEDIVFDEKSGLKYAKNQLLISAFAETDKAEIEKIADELDAKIVGYIELTGDYQIEFRDNKSLKELENIADYINSYPFVINVTLNLIIETSADIGGKQTMEYELDGMMGFDKLGLYYEVHMAGIDGECFSYNIYFENAPTDEQLEETDKAIGEFIKPYNEKDIYMGYIDVTKEDKRLSVYLDLGNVNEENQDPAIKGILKALNNVSGIKSVIVNEDCGFDF